MRVPVSWTYLAALAAPALLGTAASASAATARAQFGIRLVIAPPCPGDAPSLVTSVHAAIDLASSYLRRAPQSLSADHDPDTGYWLVRAGQEPVLRIDKCTGAVSLPGAAQQNARSLAEPGAVPASA